MVRAHWAKEKELVRKGKKPFYLKRAEQKKFGAGGAVCGVERGAGRPDDGKETEKEGGQASKDMPEGRRI